jgi:uncharacterized lipoprotein YddW (UPF0748 family)
MRVSWQHRSTAVRDPLRRPWVGWLAILWVAGCAADRPPVQTAATPGKSDDRTAGPAPEDGGWIQDAGLPDSATGPVDSGSPVAPREIRGLWVTRWDYHSPDDVRAILDDAVAAGLNQIYFQVRGEADAFYRSSLEPWGASLTGTLGKDPGWDPLAVAVAEAHRRGLALHAWFNVASAWKGRSPPPKSDPPHLLRLHPDWRVVDRRGRPMPYSEGYVFVNLAHPEVRKHILAVAAELVRGYDLDGLHLDYCRYPAADTSFDPASNKRYAAARREEPDLVREAWQRRELMLFVGSLRDQVKALRPGLVLSAAVTGIYQDRWGWGQVQRGLEDFHQDSRLWAERQVVDVLVPMIYWPPTNPPGRYTDFRTLVEDFASLKGKVTLLAGINLDAGDLSVLQRELAIAREAGFGGAVLFSWATLNKHAWSAELGRRIFPAADRTPDQEPEKGTGQQQPQGQGQDRPVSP